MNYVYAGYAVAFGGVALYALRVVLRGRALRRALGLSPGMGRPSGAQPSGVAGPSLPTQSAAATRPDLAPPTTRPSAAPASPAATVTPAGAVHSADPGGER